MFGTRVHGVALFALLSAVGIGCATEKPTEYPKAPFGMDIVSLHLDAEDGGEAWPQHPNLSYRTDIDMVWAGDKASLRIDCADEDCTAVREITGERGVGDSVQLIAFVRGEVDVGINVVRGPRAHRCVSDTSKAISNGWHTARVTCELAEDAERIELYLRPSGDEPVWISDLHVDVYPPRSEWGTVYERTAEQEN